MLQLVAGIALAALAGPSISTQPKSTDALGSAGRIPVLIVAGSDTFHDWRQTTPQLRALLEKTGRFDVRVVEDAEALGSHSVTDRYRTIILNGQTASSTSALRRNLARYVRHGGGLVAIHWAIDNFHDWHGFTDLLGRSWEEGLSAEEHGSFEVVPTQDARFVLGRIPSWRTPTGEAIHYRLKGNATIQVLATTSTAAGGENIAVAFTHRTGRGRTFFTPLGHSVTTRSDPSFQNMIVRAVGWTAGGRSEEEAGAQR